MVAFNEYYYTPEEIEKFRNQIKVGNEAAMAEIMKRGPREINPRIAALLEWKKKILDKGVEK